MTTLRDRYAEALLRRLETHEGPVADAERYMERLDVLAGVDLEQKQLTAGTPRIEGSTPVIEHGSGQEPIVSGQTRTAGPGIAPDPLPVAREEPQQVRDEALISAPPAPVSPAAASPEPIPAEPYTQKVYTQILPPPRTKKPRDKTTVEMLCACGCGMPLHIPRWEINRAPEKKFFLNRDHYHAYQRSPEGTRQASKYGGVLRDIPMDTEMAPADVTQIQEQATLEATQHDEEPARGLAAVIEKPPVEEPKATKFVCTCPDWWRAKTAGWREDIPNEGHYDDCPLYRKGGHRWPMPPQGSELKEPFTIMCGWCSDTREVDRFGVEWTKSEENPAVTITSPYSKNAKAPA